MTRPATPPPRGDRPTPTAPPPPPAWRHGLWAIAIAASVLLLFVLPALPTKSVPTHNFTYSQFLANVTSHKIKTVTIASDGAASGTLANGHDYTTQIPVELAGSSLLSRLEAAKVSIVASSPRASFGSEVVSWALLLVPFLVIFWLWRRLSKGAMGQMQGAMGVAKSRAKVFDAERPEATFADVAGYAGAKGEIAEVVDFLRRPGRYRRAGATAPRGVLMVGPPGTGKTLLARARARAVAGEAEVPFFSVAGSSFVEMFVGVGAARVRDLFQEARKRAPAIVFVDEVDAIGSRRNGSGAIVSNDEREQTLNQLLAEMDGFDLAEGVVVLAATNRPEVLDPALLRPGRFDRQVTIPLPTLAERRAILAVHCHDKRLGGDADLQVVARGTPGFSGADLANLANEAAICAVRADREVLGAADFDAARDRILLGRREGSNVLLPQEKHAVAVHEAGHALVAALSPHADPVAKVTILPAGQALGVTEQLPLVERHLYGEDYLNESLAVRLGGRAVELVCLGPVGYPQGGSMFLGSGGGGLSSRPIAEATQAAIDAEVARLLREAEERASDLLGNHRGELDRLVDLLLEDETVDGTAVYQLAGLPTPGETAAATTMAPRRAAAAGPATAEPAGMPRAAAVARGFEAGGGTG